MNTRYADLLASKVAFIGAGNMARCLIKGMLAQHFSKENVFASDVHAQTLALLKAELGIQIFADNLLAVENADIIILAVKPQKMKTVLQELKKAIQAKPSSPLIISVMAGISVDTIANNIERDDLAIVRCMPNICALIGESATGLYANAAVSLLQRDMAEHILQSVGLALWVENEKLIDAIGALSGSGPAYFFYLMEALEKAGIALGLDSETAHLLTLQTALGAARLALSENEPLATLRARVTSKGGTTETAIAVLAEQSVNVTVEQAVKAAYQRTLELSTWK